MDGVLLRRDCHLHIFTNSDNIHHDGFASKCPPTCLGGELFLADHLQCLSLKVILCSKYSKHPGVINRSKEATFKEIKYNCGVSQQNSQVNPDGSVYHGAVLKRN